MKNDQPAFNFWAMYEKFVSPLPEKIIENPEVETFKKSIMQGGMGDISFSAVILPFAKRKEQENSLRNIIEVGICCDKIKDFDYDQYYNQFLEKQNKENKELPLTDFVQILIDDKIIPAIDYKEYEEQVLNKRNGSENHSEVEKVTKTTRKMK